MRAVRLSPWGAGGELPAVPLPLAKTRDPALQAPIFMTSPPLEPVSLSPRDAGGVIPRDPYPLKKRRDTDLSTPVLKAASSYPEGVEATPAPLLLHLTWVIETPPHDTLPHVLLLEDPPVGVDVKLPDGRRWHGAGSAGGRHP